MRIKNSFAPSVAVILLFLLSSTHSVFAAASCGNQPSGQVWTSWVSSNFGSQPATTAQCPYGGTVTTQINYYQNVLCTDGKLTPVGAQTSQSAPVTWQGPTCNKNPATNESNPSNTAAAAVAPCGKQPSGQIWTSWVSSNFGTQPATTAQCPNGGTVTTQINYYQNYLCTDGKLTPVGPQTSQSAPVTWKGPTCNAVNGACGSANGVAIGLAPPSNLCSTGTASTVTNLDPWTWSCAGSSGGTNASCSAPKITLSAMTLSSPIVYPNDQLQVSSTLTVGKSAVKNIVIQTIIQDKNNNTVSNASQTISSLNANATSPVSVSFAIPGNQTLAPGTYKVLQGYPSSNGLLIANTAQFTVPAATITLNESFNDGRTSLNANVWNTFENVNTNYSNMLSVEVPDAVQTIQNQGLVLRADKRSFEGLPYTAGVISSKSLFSQTYGHFEMLAKVASGPGTYSSFWMLPEDYSLNTDEGEIDIFEHIGIQPNMMLQTLHFPPQNPGAKSNYCMTVSDYSQAYHIYGLDWTPTSLTWLIDGVPCSTQTANIPNGPMYIIASLGIGSSQTWGGAPTTATAFPATMDISYIRVWQFPNMPASPKSSLAFTGPITISPSNPSPGSLITISGQIAAGATSLTNVAQSFVLYSELPTYTTYYGLKTNNPINIAANATGQYRVTYQLPTTLRPGLYQFYDQASSTNGFSAQLLNAQEIMINNPLPPLPPLPPITP